jgi:tryptophan 2,3-dioxygenase
MQPVKTQAPEFGRGIDALLDTAYARYLDLETLFDIQVAETGTADLHHPEEVLFRSVHLSSELWLRLAAHEIERAAAAADAGRILEASRLVRRSVESIERVIENTGMLESMAAADYHQFRIYFGEASGLQSPGYAYLRQRCRAISRTLDEVVGDDDALFRLLTGPRDDPRFDFCTALHDLDASLDRFRSRHLQVARRFLGELTPGTGGGGIEYLRRNLGHELFPRLWNVADRIAKSAGAVTYGYGNPDGRG